MAMVLCMVSMAEAQQDRLDRDIRIGERILEEIFTEETEQLPVQLPGMNRVHGEYLPGVGVHYVIGRSGGARAIEVIVRRNRNEDREPADPKITREWLEDRMMEYFTGYARQLRSLPDGEQVRITYSRQPHDSDRFFNRDRSELPRITAWVTSDDLRRFEDGNLSEDQLRNRVVIHDLSGEEEKRDLAIFGSVLQTALSSTGSEHLRVSRTPSFEYLPGLGVHYQVNIRQGRGFAIGDFGNIEIDLDLENISASIPRVIMDMDSLHLSLRQLNDSLRIHSEDLRRYAEEARREAEAAAEEARREAEAAGEEARRHGVEVRRMYQQAYAEQDTIDLSADVEELMDYLLETIRDYGPTLSSLEDGEMLMITLNWSGRNPTLPEKTQIRITKEDLVSGREPHIEITRRN